MISQSGATSSSRLASSPLQQQERKRELGYELDDEHER